MKKSPNTQVRRNGSAKRAKKQAATVTTSNNPALEREPTCLCLFVDGVESAGLNLSDAEVAKIEASAKRAGESMADFLENGIKDKLAANSKAANGVTQQAGKPTPPSFVGGGEAKHLLVGGNDLTEDGIWASEDGGLFLHDGLLKTQPRAVSFDEARAWWEKFRQGEPYLLPPFFPEETAAERFTSMVCKAIKADAKAKASAKGPNAPVDLESLQSLVADGCGEGSDGLWASPDGRLYIWDGALDLQPREVSFEEARDLWLPGHQENPYLCSPYFPEGTIAQKFTSFVDEAIKAKARDRSPDLETSVCQSVALARLLAEHAEHGDSIGGSHPYNETIKAGLMMLAGEVSVNLREAFYDERAQDRASLNGGKGGVR